MTFDLCPLRKFIFWGLQSGLAAHQVTAEPCHFGPCQLLKSSAPAVLALRSWLKSFKQAIWHKFQLLVSLCGQATSPKGVIYIPWLLWSLQIHSEEKTTCQEDTRFGEHRDHKTEKEKYGGKWFLEVCISGPKLLGIFYLFFLFWCSEKKQLKLKPSGEGHCTVSFTDFKLHPPNEPAIRVLHCVPLTF